MRKNVVIIHRLLLGAAVLVLAASLVFYLSRWSSLPEEIGMHFGPDGQFDVIASRFYGFYPHIVGGLLIAGLSFAGWLIGRKPSGLRITERGEELFKSELRLTLDVISLLLGLFFAAWSRAVSLQVPLHLTVVRTLLWITLAAGAAGILAEIITCLLCKVKSDTPKDTGMSHRLSRLIAWLLTGAGTLFLAVSWERYPLDETLYADPDYYGLAYFANFDAYLDKRLLLIPMLLSIAVLIVLEVISVRAMRRQQTALVSLTDKLKFISSLWFCWWRLLLGSEQKIGIVSPILFVILCAVCFALYAKARHAAKDPS